MNLPTAVIVAVSLYPAMPDSNTRECRHQKLWGFEPQLARTGTSLATARIVLTQRSRSSQGKPREDLLARWNPDVGNVTAHRIGGYGQALSALWVVVDGGICQQVGK